MDALPRASNRAVREAFTHYKKQIFANKKWSIPSLLLPGIAVVFSSYIPPLVIGVMINHFDGKIPGSLSEALPFLLLLTGSWLFGEALWRIAFLLLNRTDTKGIYNLYVIAMQEMLKKDMSFFNDNFAGSLTKKVSGFSRSFEGFMDTLAFNVFGNLLPLIFASVILWTISPYLVLVLFGFIGITVLLIFPMVKKRQKLTSRREAMSNKVAGHVADVIGNMSSVQTFGHENTELEKHKKHVDEYTKAALKSWDYHVTHIDMTVAPLYVFINVLGLTLAITLTDSAASMAAVFVTFSYFGQATRILFEFNRTYRNLENALTEAGQFTELLFDDPKLVDKASAPELHVTKGAIDFDHINFAYSDNAEHLLFKDFKLHIQPGEKIALVGHSGGGKTTVTKLLLRFNDVTGGSLKIDDQDIADHTLNSLRKNIAYVPQEPSMFHRSIMDNIRYGLPEASDAEVILAAKKAHATEFIDKLPAGFNTMVGERGVKLSGGQRQRISIARAILKNAPILVLDEATSALDSESEVLIQEALWELMKGRTAIVIAHRLSTIQKMDRIIVLENGTIAEEGSHKKLIAKKNGTYAKLWAHQSGGFIEE